MKITGMSRIYSEVWIKRDTYESGFMMYNYSEHNYRDCVSNGTATECEKCEKLLLHGLIKVCDNCGFLGDSNVEWESKGADTLCTSCHQTKMKAGEK